MQPRTILILALSILAAPVAAQDLPVGPRGVAQVRYAGSYGYADAFVRGAYVGAPLTRFPRPSELVPAPWSYGTYGVPTVSGIPAAPIAQPTLTVIDTPQRGRTAGNASRHARLAAEDGRSAGLQVIQVRVPPR